MVMAPGLGKTITAAHDIANFFGWHATPPRVAGEYVPHTPPSDFSGRVLVLAHRKEILRQNARRFEAVLGPIDHGFVDGSEKNMGAQFVFASLHSMLRQLDGISPAAFDYIVFDEYHHEPAPTFRRVFRHFEPRFALGLTGTPDRLDGKPITDYLGEPVYSLSLARAMARNLLPPVDYHLITDDLIRNGSINLEGMRVTRSALNRTVFIDARDSALEPVIERELSLLSNPHTMVFNRSIRHAERTAAYLPGALALHSKMPASEAAANLEAFRRRQSHTLTSVDMGTEGLDIAEVNVIVLDRPTESEAVFFQQIGRALRGKDPVTVIDLVGNVDRLMAMQAFVQEVEDERATYNGASTEIDRVTVDHTGFRFHFDETARDLVRALERAERPVPGSRAEALEGVVDWIGRNNGRVPLTTDFRRDTSLPNFDRIVELWTDSPPAKASFDRDAATAYLSARELNNSLPELRFSLRPQPKSKDQVLELVIEWARTHEGRVPTSSEYQTDTSLPVYARALEWWSDSSARKDAMNRDLAVAYGERRVNHPSMPELRISFRPRPQSRHETTDLVVSWMAANGGRVPNSNDFQDNDDLPSLGTATAFWAEAPRPKYAMDAYVLRAYTARRHDHPELPAPAVPLHGQRPHPQSRAEAIEYVVTAMVQKSGDDVSAMDFEDPSLPTWRRIADNWENDRLAIRTIRREAQLRYLEAYQLDQEMPVPRFILERPPVASKEDAVTVTAEWMKNHDGRLPSAPDFRSDPALPYLEAVLRLWKDADSPKRQFNADVLARYGELAAADASLPQPLQRVTRPRITSRSDVLELVLPWMEQHAGRLPSADDFLEAPQLPHYWTAMELWAGEAIGAKAAFNLEAVELYRQRIDADRDPLVNRPEPQTREEAVAMVAQWMAANSNQLPTDSELRSDPGLPRLPWLKRLWADADEPSRTYKTDVVRAFRQLYPERGLPVDPRLKPKPISKHDALEWTTAWSAARAGERVTYAKLRQAAGLPRTSDIDQWWGEGPEARLQFEDDAAAAWHQSPEATEAPPQRERRQLRPKTEGPSQPRVNRQPAVPRELVRSDLTTREQVIALVVPWMSQNDGRVPSFHDLTVQSGLFSYQVVNRLWQGGQPSAKVAFNQEAAAAYQTARASDPLMPAPQAPSPSRPKGLRPVPSSRDEAVAAVAAWALEHGGRIPTKDDFADRSLPRYSQIMAFWKDEVSPKQALDAAVSATLQTGGAANASTARANGPYGKACLT